MNPDPLSLLMAIPAIGPYVPYITLAVTIASAAATVLPAPAAGAAGVYPVVYGVIHWVAINKGRAAVTPPAP